MENDQNDNMSQNNGKGLFRGLYLLLLLLISFSPGCEKIDELTHFDMEYEETVIIPSLIGINLPFNLYSPDIKSSSEQVLELNDTRKELVESIYLKSLVLEINDAGKDFDFLEDIEIYLKADGLEEQRIASLYDLKNEQKSKLEAHTNEVELKDYILKDEFTLKVVAKTDELILSDHPIKITALFFVDARLFGV